MTTATVRERYEDEGRGVLDSAETPGFKQEGFDLRAVRVVP